MTLKNAVTKGVKAWRDRRVGYWLCIDPKTGEYYLLTSANLAELNGTQVGAADYRMAEGEETIYRSGLEIRAEKHDTRRISPNR